VRFGVRFGISDIDFHRVIVRIIFSSVNGSKFIPILSHQKALEYHISNKLIIFDFKKGPRACHLSFMTLVMPRLPERDFIS